MEQSFRRGVPDLWYLARVQRAAEPNVDVVLEQLRIVPYRLWHRNGTRVRQRTVEQVVEVDVVHALADVRYPSRLLLHSRGYQVHRDLWSAGFYVKDYLEVTGLELGAAASTSAAATLADAA